MCSRTTTMVPYIPPQSLPSNYACLWVSLWLPCPALPQVSIPVAISVFVPSTLTAKRSRFPWSRCHAALSASNLTHEKIESFLPCPHSPSYLEVASIHSTGTAYHFLLWWCASLLCSIFFGCIQWNLHTHMSVSLLSGLLVTVSILIRLLCVLWIFLSPFVSGMK